MAEAKTQSAPQTAAHAEASAPSLLDQAINATRSSEPSEVQDLLRTLTEEANRGTVTFSKNLTVTMKLAPGAGGAVNALSGRIPSVL